MYACIMLLSAFTLLLSVCMYHAFIMSLSDICLYLASFSLYFAIVYLSIPCYSLSVRTMLLPTGTCLSLNFLFKSLALIFIIQFNKVLQIKKLQVTGNLYVTVAKQ